MPDDTISSMLEETEELIEAGADTAMAMRSLLAAPLAVPVAKRLSQLISHAVGTACIATASLLDDTLQAQPHLHRLSSAWLSLDLQIVGALGVNPSSIWSRLVECGGIVSLVETHNAQTFKHKWNELALSIADTCKPQPLVAAGNAIGQRLFKRMAPLAPMIPDEDVRSVESVVLPSYLALKSVLSAIDAIKREMRTGNDRKAEIFLRQLYDAQMAAGSNGAQYAVKSLCSVASYAQTLGSGTWELRCLETALQIAPSDSVALVQMGDFHKRNAQREAAKDYLKRAIANSVGENLIVAQSALADVYTVEKQYDVAEEMYKAIPGWRDIESVVTAMADLRRHRGDLDAAIVAYNEAIPRFSQCARLLLGRAECHKQSGQLQLAVNDYNRVELCFELSDRDRSFCYLGRSHVLALSGRTLEALADLDRAMAIRTFDRFVRLRKSVLLATAEADGNVLLDKLSRRIDGIEEWYRHFVRGLVIVAGMDSQHKVPVGMDALRRAVDLLSSSENSSQRDADRRMSAAIAWIANGRSDLALEQFEESDVDGVALQVDHVLRVAHARKIGDEQSLSLTMEFLSSAATENEQLKRCVDAAIGADHDVVARELAILVLMAI